MERLTKVRPFDEVCFAVDLPSKEKTEPSRLLHYAEKVLRVMPFRYSHAQPLHASRRRTSVEDAALRKARDALTAAPGTPSALLKQLTRELLQELRIEGVLCGSDVTILVRCSCMVHSHPKTPVN